MIIRRCRITGSIGNAAISHLSADRATIEDTIIDGTWNVDCVTLRNEATLRRCIVRGAAGACVRTNENAVMDHCIIGPSTGPGIVVNGRSTISNCAVDRSGGIGIDTGFQSLVQSCRSTTNTTGGIRVSSNSLVRGCFVEYHPNNGQFGIHANGNDIQVIDNSIERCNIGIDFRAVSGCVALRNIGRANTLNVAISFGGNWYPNVDFSTLNTATNPFANLFT